MQKEYYDRDSSFWTVENRDPVVGAFDAHNAWDGYNNLFVGIKDLQNKVCLDFGCGVGRNVSKYFETFKQIDGVDLSQVNLDNARKWLDFHKQTYKPSNLILCNGVDLSCIQDEQYDIIMSTITLQHICVYAIRYNYLKEFYRVLKSGGIITIQMGYGYSEHKVSVPYYENFYDAKTTNGYCDVRIEKPWQIKDDLSEIGFHSFSYLITDCVPGDTHKNAIYFRAAK